MSSVYIQSGDADVEKRSFVYPGGDALAFDGRLQDAFVSLTTLICHRINFTRLPVSCSHVLPIFCAVQGKNIQAHHLRLYFISSSISTLRAAGDHTVIWRTVAVPATSRVLFQHESRLCFFSTKFIEPARFSAVFLFVRARPLVFSQRLVFLAEISPRPPTCGRTFWSTTPPTCWPSSSLMTHTSTWERRWP